MNIPCTWITVVLVSALFKGNYFATSKVEVLEILIIIALIAVVIWDTLNTYIQY